MVCGNGKYSCLVDSTVQSQAECETTTFCLHPNGSLVKGNCPSGSGECRYQTRDTTAASPAICGTKPCTQQQCESFVRCSISDYFESVFPPYNTSRGGLCFVDINLASTSGQWCFTENFASQWVPAPNGCAAYDVDKDACLGTGLGLTKRWGPGTWIPYGTYNSVESCNSITSRCEVNISSWRIQSAVWKEPKSQEICTDCSGTTVPNFSYEKAFWIPAVEFKGSWKRAEKILTNSVKNQFSYVMLGDAVNNALHNKYTFDATTLSLCLHIPKSVTIQALTCQCDSSSNDVSISRKGWGGESNG
eukprot:TRINITY_DN6796_c0_g1_i5.p1 TRINITY_DN6796_c0_g1~~TRINITY_DN6796_c0_g1_i5.p1  ORF type:complete len:304 (-),score=48.74 TRINITY_DN6796_c0_g1_i5:1540-2451(-)